MNGQMMNYKRYYESLKNTPEPDDVENPVAIDYKGLIAYAEERNLEPCDLSDEEKSRFIISKEAAVV